jgi:hypothetical protein
VSPAKSLDYRLIRLPVIRDGQKILRTFEGAVLAGLVGSGSIPVLVAIEGVFVFMAKSGKLVVYWEKRQAIEIYASFAIMRPYLPDAVYLQAARCAGVEPPETFPEEPLEV